MTTANESVEVGTGLEITMIYDCPKDGVRYGKKHRISEPKLKSVSDTEKLVGEVCMSMYDLIIAASEGR